MKINKKEQWQTREIKVQQAAEAAVKILAVQGYEASAFDLYESWINWNELDMHDVSSLSIEMMKDHKKIVDEGIFV